MSKTADPHDSDSDLDEKVAEQGDAKPVVKKPTVELAYQCDIVDMVARHFAEDAEETICLDKWIFEKCELIDLEELSAAEKKGEDITHKLQYTTLHEEFKAMYETRLEAYISQLGWTVPRFYEQIKTADEESNGESATSMIGEVLMATFDYERFFVMMKEAAEAKRQGNFLPPK